MPVLFLSLQAVLFRRKVLSLLPQVWFFHHLQTIAGFLRLAGDIPALYGEPLTEYGKCYEALEFLIEGVLARLKDEEEQ